MIKVLSDEVVDRIAAGEVVERPAAVVKELVENALDAGADAVEVSLEAGGRRLVEVADNGEGISPEDLALVFLRHATSKLSSLEDLSHIASLGFRGEALASIGAVSQAQIKSRQRGALEGALVVNRGGAVEPPRPAGCPEGTTVVVRNLFFNVPPRLKFMKTEATELSHCVECVTRFALAYPHVKFVLRHNGREVFQVGRDQDPLERIGHFLGGKVAKQLIPLVREELGVRLTGHLGRPELGRRDLRKSYIFLNGRHVRDKAVHAALRRAYREVMPEKFHPLYILHLTMPPDWVDVNVHPTKTEVRFLDGARIFSAVFRAASDALAGGERSVAAPAAGAGPTPGTVHGPVRTPLGEALSAALFGGSSIPGPSARVEEYGDPGREGAPPAVRRSWGGKERDRVSDRPISFAEEPGARSPGRIVQIHNTYAVFEIPHGLAIVDQHALHERVLYDGLRREYDKGGIRLQNLLVPVVLDLEPSQAARASEICFDLNHLGIRAEIFGKDAVRVTAIPALLRNADPHALAAEVIDCLSGGGSGEEAYREILQRLACRASVKAGDVLHEEALRSLLDSAAKVEHSGRCPHGRPTTVVLTLAELEAMFKRRGF